MIIIELDNIVEMARIKELKDITLEDISYTYLDKNKVDEAPIVVYITKLSFKILKIDKVYPITFFIKDFIGPLDLLKILRRLEREDQLKTDEK